MLRTRHLRTKLLISCAFLIIFWSFSMKFRHNTQTSRTYELNQNEIIYSLNKNLTDLRHSLNEMPNDLEELKSNQFKINHQIYDTNSSEYKAINPYVRKLKNPGDKYIILEYTNVFFVPKFCDRTSEQIFNSHIEACEYNNCEYTCDKTNYLSKADVLLFHQRDLEAEYALKYKSFSGWIQNTKQLPFKTTEEKLKNNRDQIWVLWNDEATKVDQEFNSISQFFNWTLSYKTDAEIFEGSYGFFLPNQRISETEMILYRQKIEKNFFDRKNAILWFVSNCKSKLRSKVALEISQHYPLHIYGRCDLSEKLTASEIAQKYPYLKVFSYESMGPNCGLESQCEKLKFESYKYYLAFENNNCTDYVTEKIWKSLNNQMIPIVLQPSRDSYQRYSIPTKSFIHLEDFKFSVQSLIKHLNQIDNDINLYFNYLKWTSFYLKTYNNGKETEPHRMCQLCKRLNTYKHNVNYLRIADFFNDKCKL